MDVWNRVGNWHGSDFTICNESSKVGSKDNLEISSGFTDYTVLLVSAFRISNTTWARSVTTITKVGGVAADDSFVWPYTSGADSDTTAIGWMANETYNSWSPASTIDDVNLMAFGKGPIEVLGLHASQGQRRRHDGDGENQLYRGFATQSRDNHQNSCGMLVGAVLNVNIEDVHFKNGYYWSLAFMRQRVCYPLRVRNVRFSKGVHLSDCSIWGEDWVFDYARNCAILGTGAELVPEGSLRAFVRCPGHRNYSLACGRVDRGWARYPEGEFQYRGRWHLGSERPVRLLPESLQSPWESRHFARRVVRRTGKPCDLYRRYRSEFDIDRKSRLRADRYRQWRNSPDGTWQDVLGQVKIDPHVYMGEVNEYLNTYGSGNTNPQYASIKTIDDLSYGLPPCGSFVDRMHEFASNGPPKAARKSGHRRRPGSRIHSMPWVPSDFSGSAYQHAMSAFVPSLYCEATIPWPTSTTVIPISGHQSAWPTACSRRF